MHYSIKQFNITNSLFRSATVAIFAVLVLLLFVKEARALTISPTSKEFTLDPGATARGQVLVRNNTTTNSQIDIEFKNFESDNESGAPNFVESFYGLATWITTEPKNFILWPGESKRINYIIQIPKDAPPGGHFAGILLNESSIQKDGTTTISNQLASLLLVKIAGDVIEKGEIKEFFIEELTTDPLEINFAIRFENSGNIFLKPYGTIVLTNFLGRRIATLDVNDAGGNVLPASGRKFNLIWKPDSTDSGVIPIRLGKYKAIASIFFGSSDTESNVEINFWIINRNGLILLVLSTALAVLLGIKIVKLFKKRKFFVERI